jgi:hypothetical protein
MSKGTTRGKWSPSSFVVLEIFLSAFELPWPEYLAQPLSRSYRTEQPRTTRTITNPAGQH